MAHSADRNSALKQWRQWAEQEIAGSPERVEAAFQAATASLDMGKSSDEIASAARDAAAELDSQNAKRSAIPQWQRWVEQQIGGSPDRIAAATQAAMVAINQHSSESQIVAAAQGAASAWDLQHPSAARPRSGFWAWLKYRPGGRALLIVVIVLTVVLAVEYFRQPAAVIRAEARGLEKIALADLAALTLLVLLYLFRRRR
jgi:hypothetical protein